MLHFAMVGDMVISKVIYSFRRFSLSGITAGGDRCIMVGCEEAGVIQEGSVSVLDASELALGA